MQEAGPGAGVPPRHPACGGWGPGVSAVPMPAQPLRPVSKAENTSS